MAEELADNGVPVPEGDGGLAGGPAVGPAPSTPESIVDPAPGAERDELVRELVASAQARANLYRVVASLVAAPPNEMMLARLAGSGTRGIAESLESDDMLAGASMLEDFLANVDMAALLDMRVDFGLSVRDAPAVTTEPVPSGEEPFARLRKLTADAGLDVPAGPRQSFPLACSFMAQLCDRQAKALARGDLDAAAANLRAQGAIRDEHILPWADVLAAHLEATCKSPFYLGGAKLICGFVREDGPFVTDSLAAVEELRG